MVLADPVISPAPERPTGAYDFSQVPDVKGLPPGIGVFTFNQPKGPGYYSVLDQILGNYRESPPKYGYTRLANQPQPFYESDFRYLDNPNNTDVVWTDSLKRIKIGDNWMFSTGGQAWSRYMDVLNQGLGKTRSVEDLNRVRAYGDLWYKDEFRIYIEYISADSIWQSIPPAPVDVEKNSFLNAFIDLKIAEVDGSPVYVRGGRQEMAFGSQRLISTIDFLNTRRTFDGFRGTYRGDDWDFDAFYTRPVVPNANHISSMDDKVNFSGGWATYHPNKTDLIDMYYLWFNNNNTVSGLGITQAPNSLHTIGTRYFGLVDGGIHWDLENAFQTGTVVGQTVWAGMSTTGVGYNWKNAAWNPTLWAYFDYASGTHDPGPGHRGSYNTFNPMFGFGHNYLGGMDVIGRSNIIDPNLQLAFFPTNWLSVWIQAHQVWLASRYDSLNNIYNLPIRRDPTGASGTDVGQELNFIFNFHLTANQDIQVGYGHLFGGEFLRKTGTSQIDYTYVTYNIKW
jgi:hypothetical protein